MFGMTVNSYQKECHVFEWLTVYGYYNVKVNRLTWKESSTDEFLQLFFSCFRLVKFYDLKLTNLKHLFCMRSGSFRFFRVVTVYSLRKKRETSHKHTCWKQPLMFTSFSFIYHCNIQCFSFLYCVNGVFWTSSQYSRKDSCWY